MILFLFLVNLLYVQVCVFYFQCEGKEYNHKSDMWALGCILYEMASRQKTFEGSNLPALVNKIMKVQENSDLVKFSRLYSQLINNSHQHVLKLACHVSVFQGQFAPIRGNYSPEFRVLVSSKNHHWCMQLIFICLFSSDLLIC